MPWMSYAKWTGAVNNARVRVPEHMPLGTAAYGQSRNVLSLLRGAACTLVAVLPPGANKPTFVQFPGQLRLDYAGVLRVRRSENTPEVWKELHTLLMNDSETDILVLRRNLDLLEIEHR